MSVDEVAQARRRIHQTFNNASQILRRNRRQYHEYGPPLSYWNRNKPNIVVGGIIGLCTAGFTYSWYAEQVFLRTRKHKRLDSIRNNFVCSLDNWRAGRWWTLITPSVMHFGGTHLFLNMLGLWSFSFTFVSLFGVSGLAGIWLAGGTACSAASLIWQGYLEKESKNRAGYKGHNSHLDQRPSGSVGASGSILGLSAATMCRIPSLRVSLIGLPVPLWGTNLGFAAFSVYCMVNDAFPGIGHAGHLGGMAGGIAYFYGITRPWLRRSGRI
ncbi:hypothetical protein MMC28_004508 [Mycoblastus sanguinarius]|nr:hypothetical protein [Mycoblastus sanguinarius]